MTRQRPEEDPILLEIVDAELEPYKGLLPPDLLEHFRREALALLATHPYPAALLQQLRKPPAVKESGTLGPAEDEDDGERALSGRRGGGR